MQTIPIDARSGVQVVVSTRSGATSQWITLDFYSAAGCHDGHDLTVVQTDALIAALIRARDEMADRSRGSAAG